MWERFEMLMKERKLRIADVARETGISYSTFTDWKAGRYTPKAGKMLTIAKYFGVEYSYLMGLTDQRNNPQNAIDVTATSDLIAESYMNEVERGKIEPPENYYLNDKTADVAQQLFDNEDMRILFDAARDCKPEDLRMAADILKRLKQTNPDG